MWGCWKGEVRLKKIRRATHRPLNLPTLASFPTWGDSAGASHVRSPDGKGIFPFGNFQTLPRQFFLFFRDDLCLLAEVLYKTLHIRSQGRILRCFVISIR